MSKNKEIGDDMLDARDIKNAPIRLGFVTESNTNRHFHEDIELLYIFDGSLDITIENDVFHMSKDDFIIINATKLHHYTIIEDSLVGSFMISYSRVKEMTKQTNLVFWCNTILEQNSSFVDVRRTIRDIINEYVQDSDIGMMRLVSKYYELLYLLTKNFLITNRDTHNEDSMNEDKLRIDEISNYIQANYRNRISLNDLADMLYLSDAYLSKYIKKHFGMNFLEYLNSYRLNHAVDDLLYLDLPITRVALENGFASVPTFNKVFKQRYKLTPSAYKAKYRSVDNDTIVKEVDNSQMLKRVEKALADYEMGVTTQEDGLKEHVIVDVTQSEPYEKTWNKMINIGTAQELLRSNMQEDVLELHQKLNFKYVRIWDLYSPEMYIDINAKNGMYNFDKLNRVLDFLVSNSIYPYIELNIKPKQLLQNIHKILIYGKKEIEFSSLDTVHNFFEAFIIHLVERYGAKEIEKWYFEFWKEETGDIRYPSVDDDENPYDYLNAFSIIQKIFKQYIPRTKFGGAGLSIRFGEKTLVNMLNAWSHEEEQPDFLSFYCYPYMMGTIDGDRINKTSMDRDFLINYISMAKKLLNKAEFKVKEFHISEWNSTISNRNQLNDSCYKGAYILKNIIDSFDSIDLLGYWFASDITADYYDSTLLLNGGSGLLTKDGIRKPAYYAFEFLNRIGNNLIKKGKNYLLTTGDYNEWEVVCHNYKFLSYEYFINSEDEVKFKKQYRYFEDQCSSEFEFVMDEMENGIYEIKTYAINTQYGSVQDEWIRMSCPNNLTQEEIEYLKRICVPRLSIQRLKVEADQLKFKTHLEPNEIQYIKIIHKLK